MKPSTPIDAVGVGEYELKSTLHTERHFREYSETTVPLKFRTLLEEYFQSPS